jgi:hypothetical protein
VDLSRNIEVPPSFINVMTLEKIRSATMFNIDFNMTEPDDYPDYAVGNFFSMVQKKLFVIENLI